MTVEGQARIEAFWDAYRHASGRADARYVEAFIFGNSERLADYCAAQVLAGVKTATSSLLWQYEQEDKPLPAVGDLWVMLNWAKEPLAVIETTEVRVVPFDEVDERIAADYGEGERTLTWWREHMWDYYVAVECPALGREPARDMPLVCEWFRVVYREGGEPRAG
jgi:uncharacterized protein YhfF